MVISSHRTTTLICLCVPIILCFLSTWVISIPFGPLSTKAKRVKGVIMSLALHYWMGDVHHCSRAPVSEMTYTVSSGTLNPSIPYHTCILAVDRIMTKSMFHWRTLLIRNYSTTRCGIVLRQHNAVTKIPIEMMHSHIGEERVIDRQAYS